MFFGDSVGPVLHSTARKEFIADYRDTFIGLVTSWALKGALVLGLPLVVHGIHQSSEKRIQAFIDAGYVARDLCIPHWSDRHVSRYHWRSNSVR